MLPPKSYLNQLLETIYRGKEKMHIISELCAQLVSLQNVLRLCLIDTIRMHLSHISFHLYISVTFIVHMHIKPMDRRYVVLSLFITTSCLV